MNTCVFSGWVSDEGNEYTHPKGTSVIMFRLTVDGDLDEPYALKMRVEDPELMRTYGPWLTRGRIALVHCRARIVPIVRHGVVIGDTVAFVVQRAEFPNRSKAAEGAEPAEPKAVNTEGAEKGAAA